MTRNGTGRTWAWALAALAGLVGTQAALAQPANNACSNATTLSGTLPIVIAGTTVGATNDGLGGTCFSNGRDVWYSYTTTRAGVMTVDTCAAASFDTIIEVRNGSCTGPQLGCNNNACANIRSQVNVNVTAGQTVLIRVSGSTSTGNGTFTLTVNVGDGVPAAALGPDVTVGAISDVQNWGTVGAITGYSVGTTSWNIGDVPVLWVDNNNYTNNTPPIFANEHPVIGQNMFRYRAVTGTNFSRFEQLGQSWLKHGFVSVNGSQFATCVQPPLGGDQLGVNCSDPYGAGLNGSQGSLGPRSEVNPTTGIYPFPFGGTGVALNNIAKRLQVATADISPAVGRYFVDTQYITQDDAQYVRPGQTIATNALNNASWRELAASQLSAGNSSNFLNSTQQRAAGIAAWQAADPQVVLVNADHIEPNNQAKWANMSVRSRFIVGARVIQLPNGNFRYFYNVYNLNSDRAAQAFTIPLGASDSALNPYFRHPLSHSQEPFSNDPWTLSRNGNTAVWSTQTFATNANANAIRWGTMYTFEFETAAAPTTGEAFITLFKPGATGTVNQIPVPGIPVPTVITPPACRPDYNGDTVLNTDDISDYITDYFTLPAVAGPGGYAAPCAGAPAPYNTAGYRADYNSDCLVNTDDISDYITAYFTGC